MRRELRGILAVVVALLALTRAAGALDVVVISDLNGSYGSVRYDARVKNAVARIIEMDPDLVISTGDMVAGQRKPHLSEKEVRAMMPAGTCDLRAIFVHDSCDEFISTFLMGI